MKRRFALTSLLLAVLGFTAAAAEDKPVIPEDKFIYCTVCHGIQMGGNSVIQAPRLSGMKTEYLERQLHAFKNGWRGTRNEDTYGQEMRPMVAALTDREIAEVSKFVNATVSAVPTATVEGDVTRGRALYASCTACHGVNGEGNEVLAAPSLTGLNDWYLLTQLKHFKTGVRGSAAGDTYGQQMKAAAQLLADDQAMQDVVRYIGTLTAK